MDGRKSRADVTKAAILAACRQLMREGDFRPTVDAVAARAHVSKRSVFQHFKSVGKLHAVALEDPAIGAAILLAVCGGSQYAFATPVAVVERIIQYVVFGKPTAARDTSWDDVDAAIAAEEAK